MSSQISLSNHSFRISNNILFPRTMITIDGGVLCKRGYSMFRGSCYSYMGLYFPKRICSMCVLFISGLK